MQLSVIILNWNGEKLLRKFLPSVVSYSSLPGVQVVLVDNCSSDNSLEYLKNNFPRVKVIVTEKNLGYAGGYNYALSVINTEYSILLNSDVEVTQDWLPPLIKTLDEMPDVAVCMPKIKDYKNKDFFEYAGAAGGYIDKFGYPFCKGRIVFSVEKDEGQYNSLSRILWASGAAFVIRTELFVKAGGFDTDFFAHMEEIDLCWRLKNMGFNIVYVPDSSVYHVGGGTLSEENPKKLYLNYRNNLFMLYKNLRREKLFYILPLRLFLDILSAVFYLARLRFSACFVVFKAHFSFFMSLSQLRKKYKQGLKICQPKDHPEMYNKSIVFDYFLRKKRTFRKLSF